VSCYRPNVILFDTSTEPRKQLKFLSGNNRKKPLEYEWFNEMNDRFKKYGLKREYVQVPCNQCAGCQEATSKEWAIRCVLEAEKYKHNYFITLTYRDEELYYPEFIYNKTNDKYYEDDGSWIHPSLKPKDMEKFIDDLRRYYDYHHHHTGIRVYYAGEYGEKSARPHYHLIAFNLPIRPEDLKIYRINTDGSVYYTCDYITKIWKHGHVVIGEVNWDTCAYTARYVMKKMKYRPKEWYYKRGLLPEYVRMSNRPGIAREAYTPDFYKNDEIIIKGHRQSIRSAKPPRYYDKIYDIDNHKNMVRIKERREELAAASQRREMQNTSLSIRDHLRMKQEKKNAVWGSLKRNKV